MFHSILAVRPVLTGPYYRHQNVQSNSQPGTLTVLRADEVQFGSHWGRQLLAALALAGVLAPTAACGNGSVLPEVQPGPCVTYQVTSEEQIAREPWFPKEALCQLEPARIDTFIGPFTTFQVPFLAWDADAKHFIELTLSYFPNKDKTKYTVNGFINASTRFNSGDYGITIKDGMAYLPNGLVIEGSTGIVYKQVPQPDGTSKLEKIQQIRVSD